SAAVIWKAGGGASAIQDPFGIYELPICRVNGGTFTDLRPFTGAWRKYTPTWTASGVPGSVNPVYGSTTIQASYIEVDTVVHFQIRLDFGSNANGGLGFLNLGLPKPLVAFPGVVIGSAQYYHPSGGGTWYNGVLNGYQNAFQIF